MVISRRVGDVRCRVERAADGGNERRKVKLSWQPMESVLTLLISTVVVAAASTRCCGTW